MRCRVSVVLGLAGVLLASTPALAASRWSELTPSTYQGPGTFSVTGQVTWDLSGALAGHPGNHHTGSLFISRTSPPEPAYAVLSVRDEACTGPADDRVCDLRYDASGIATLTTWRFTPSTGVIRAAGAVDAPSSETTAPGVTAPALGFDVTLSPTAYTPFDRSPAAATEIQRYRTDQEDTYRYTTTQDGAATVTGSISRIPAKTRALPGSYLTSFGDEAALGQVIPPITAPAEWIPFRAKGSVSASAEGSWTGTAPVTSTGFRLPGNTWIGLVNGLIERPAAGGAVEAQAYGQLQARRCTTGQAFEDCQPMGTYAFSANPASYRLDTDGTLTMSGTADLASLSGTRRGTLPLTLVVAPSGTGTGLINTTSTLIDGARVLQQTRLAGYTAVSASATVGSLRFSTRPDGSQNMSFQQEFSG